MYVVAGVTVANFWTFWQRRAIHLRKHLRVFQLDICGQWRLAKWRAGWVARLGKTKGRRKIINVGVSCALAWLFPSFFPFVPLSRRRVGRVPDKKITRHRTGRLHRPDATKVPSNVTFQATFQLPVHTLPNLTVQTRFQNTLPWECKLLDKEHNAVSFVSPLNNAL